MIRTTQTQGANLATQLRHGAALVDFVLDALQAKLSFSNDGELAADGAEYVPGVQLALEAMLALDEKPAYEVVGDAIDGARQAHLDRLDDEPVCIELTRGGARVLARVLADQAAADRRRADDSEDEKLAELVGGLAAKIEAAL